MTLARCGGASFAHSYYEALSFFLEIRFISLQWIAGENGWMDLLRLTLDYGFNCDIVPACASENGSPLQDETLTQHFQIFVRDARTHHLVELM